MRGRPFVVLLFPIAAGILLARYSFVPYPVWAAAGTLALSGAVILRNSRTRDIFLCAAFVCVFAAHMKAGFVRPPDHIALAGRYFLGESVRVTGTVVSDASVRVSPQGERTSFEMEVSAVRSATKEADTRGRILVHIFRQEQLAPGQIVLLEGRLRRPFDRDLSRKLSYREYLRSQGIEWILGVRKNGVVKVTGEAPLGLGKKSLLALRRYWSGELGRYLPDGESGLMRAILLGDRQNIPKPVRELFTRTGTAHILAISGMNIAIVAGLLLIVMKVFPIPRRAQFGLTILLVMGYAALTGGQASVVRAALMAAVLLSGFVVERESDILNSLALSAVILMTARPLNLFDIGFQLSFASVLALIVLYPPLEKGMEGWPFPRCVRQAAAVSLAAWLGVAGLVAYYFEIITPVTLLANLLIVPLITVLMPLGLGLLAAGSFVPALAPDFASCAGFVLNLLIAVIAGVDRLPGAYIFLKDVSWWAAALYYAGLGALAARFVRPTPIGLPAD